jgi:hypothetical protein
MVPAEMPGRNEPRGTPSGAPAYPERRYWVVLTS